MNKKGYLLYELIITIVLISSLLILMPSKMMKPDIQIAEKFVENLRNDIYLTKLQSSTYVGVYRIRFNLNEQSYTITDSKNKLIKKVVYDKKIGIINQLTSSEIEIYYGTVTYPGTLFIRCGAYSARLTIKEMSGLIEVVKQ
jgi:hypothetical protein